MKGQQRTWLVLSAILIVGVGIFGTISSGRSGKTDDPNAKSPFSSQHGHNVQAKVSPLRNKPAAPVDELELERQMTGIISSLGQLEFSDNPEMFKIELREEIEDTLSFPLPERYLMQATIARRFMEQFSASPTDLDTIIRALGLYESVLSELSADIGPKSPLFEVLLQSIPLQVTSNVELSGLWRDRLLEEFSVSGSELYARAAGAVIGGQAISSKSMDLDAVISIENQSVKAEAERIITWKAHYQKRFGSGAPIDRSFVDFLPYFLGDTSAMKFDTTALSRLIGATIGDYPDEVSAAVFEAPIGPKRDYSIQLMVAQMARQGPEIVEKWVDEIESPSVKQSVWRSYEESRARMKGEAMLAPVEPDPFAN